MTSFRIIDEAHTAAYKGQRITVLSTRCPRSFASSGKEESGAYCNIKYDSGRIECDVPMGKLTFGLPEPEFDMTRARAISGLPPKLECVK